VAGSAADTGEAVESTSAEDEVVHRDDVDAEIAEMDAAAAEALDASSAVSSAASSDNGPDGPSTREV
jgi:hypothetical protein